MNLINRVMRIIGVIAGGTMAILAFFLPVICHATRAGMPLTGDDRMALLAMASTMVLAGGGLVIVSIRGRF